MTGLVSTSLAMRSTWVLRFLAAQAIQRENEELALADVLHLRVAQRRQARVEWFDPAGSRTVDFSMTQT